MMHIYGCTLGCTIQRPHSRCLEGGHLFGAFIQAKYALSTATHQQQHERWQISTSAQQAYLSHVVGWREGDLRIRRWETTWLIDFYQQGRWFFHKVTEEGPLQAWLLEQGYRRYAPLENRDEESLAGYYRKPARGKTTRVLDLGTSGHPLTPPPAEVHTSASNAESGEIDVRTHVAILLAILVARSAHPLTALDRLYLQRQAVQALLSHGIERIGQDDVRKIEALINEAVQVREQLERRHQDTLS
jgi:hypothetical protein